MTEGFVDGVRGDEPPPLYLRGREGIRVTALVARALLAGDRVADVRVGEE